tara:strand:- start:762 stop:1187 length:426 start_codon:yes stop_codon:yes gene_type:complete
MPSKNGFGNSRTPMKKVGYGSAMHYKNPVKMTAAQETLPENLKAGIRAKEEKDSGLKMYGKSPMKKDTGEVVSKNSPGAGWTKTKGTNIWAPPVADKMFGQKKGKLVKDSIKKVARPSKKSTITDNKSMKPPYKKPVGPRA